MDDHGRPWHQPTLGAMGIPTEAQSTGPQDGLALGHWKARTVFRTVLARGTQLEHKEHSPWHISTLVLLSN